MIIFFSFKYNKYHMINTFLVKLFMLGYINYMILYKYILRTHIAPFTFSAVTIILIFLLQFLMKFADRLVGKGLDTWVVIQLIIFSLAWMVALVVPMAVLIAALMAFGTMSQNNEVTIMKSSGISLYKMMIPPFLASIVLGYLLLMFNNDVLPDANHRLKYLMQDISNKKPTLSLRPGFFSQDISNYAILVRSINENTNILSEVTIYDYTEPLKIKVVTAEKGKIFFSKDQSKLIMDLQKGEIHESDVQQTHVYRKLVFEKHRIAMNSDQFSFQQSTPGGPRGERELSSKYMLDIVDSLEFLRDSYVASMTNEVSKHLFADSTINTSPFPKSFGNKNDLVYRRAIEKTRTAKNFILSQAKRVEYNKAEIDKYMVEVHKKYALPVACVVFLLIGAPLGIMVRKGGFGAAASISLFFFLIYWAFLIGGEKLSERGFFSPFLGMWSANILLTIAGLILTFKTNRETVTLSFTFFKKLIPKQWRDQEAEQ